VQYGKFTKKRKGRKSCLTIEHEADLKIVILKTPVEFGYDEKYWNRKLIR